MFSFITGSSPSQDKVLPLEKKKPKPESDNKCSSIWGSCLPMLCGSNVYVLEGEEGRVASEEFKERDEDSLQCADQHATDTAGKLGGVAHQMKKPLKLFGVTVVPGDVSAKHRKDLGDVVASGWVSFLGSRVGVLKTDSGVDMKGGQAHMVDCEEEVSITSAKVQKLTTRSSANLTGSKVGSVDVNRDLTMLGGEAKKVESGDAYLRGAKVGDLSAYGDSLQVTSADVSVNETGRSSPFVRSEVNSMRFAKKAEVKSSLVGSIGTLDFTAEGKRYLVLDDATVMDQVKIDNCEKCKVVVQGGSHVRGNVDLDPTDHATMVVTGKSTVRRDINISGLGTSVVNVEKDSTVLGDIKIVSAAKFPGVVNIKSDGLLQGNIVFDNSSTKGGVPGTVSVEGKKGFMGKITNGTLIRDGALVSTSSGNE